MIETFRRLTDPANVDGKLKERAAETNSLALVDDKTEVVVPEQVPVELQAEVQLEITTCRPFVASEVKVVTGEAEMRRVGVIPSRVPPFVRSM